MTPNQLFQPLKAQFNQSLILGLVFLCVVGCVSHPAFEEPVVAVSVPKNFKGEQPDEQLIAGKMPWWESFNDKTLNDLLGLVDRQNFQLKATTGRILQSEALVRARRSLGLPQVEASGAIEREQNSQNETSQTGPFNFTRFEAGLSYGWELDLWNRIEYEVEAAKADAEVLRQFKKDLELSVKWRIARNYFAIRFIDLEKEVIEQSIEARQENVVLAKELLDAGIASDLDGARAQSELARTKAALARLDGPRADRKSVV